MESINVMMFKKMVEWNVVMKDEQIFQLDVTDNSKFVVTIKTYDTMHAPSTGQK